MLFGGVGVDAGVLVLDCVIAGLVGPGLLVVVVVVGVEVGIMVGLADVAGVVRQVAAL